MAKGQAAELEQKISVTPADLEKIFQALVKRARTDVSHKYRPRDYYDTDDLDLYQAHQSLRVQYLKGNRGQMGGYEQTLKFELPKNAAMPQGALLRKECKDRIASHAPELAAVSDAEGKAAAVGWGKRLSHIFTAAVERRFFEIETGHGKNRGTVEVAFDRGDIILPLNGQHSPLVEIELELKGGSPDAIRRIEEHIFKIAPSAKIQTESKSDQGTRLYMQAKGIKP